MLAIAATGLARAQEPADSGVPIGGIGAGKFELHRTGKVTNVATQNNWDLPIAGSTLPVARRRAQWKRVSEPTDEGVTGAFLAHWVEGAGARVGKTHARAAFTTMAASDLGFEGRFPFAHYRYAPHGGVRVSLTAFGSFPIGTPGAAGDEFRDACLPAGLFAFELSNETDAPREAAVLLSWQNLSGVGGFPGFARASLAGQQARVVSEPGLAGLALGKDSPPDDPRVRRFTSETVLIVPDQPGVAVTVLPRWNEAGSGEDLWGAFADDGRLPVDPRAPDAASEVHGGAGFSGAVAASVALAPGERRDVWMVLAWWAPDLVPGQLPTDRPAYVDREPAEFEYGVRYARWFDDALDVARHVAENRERLRTASGEAPRRLEASSLPEWLVARLLNGLFPAFTNTVATRDLRFSVLEAPTVMRGCLGTIDQRLATQPFWAACFPSLDRAELELFAADRVDVDHPHRFGPHWDFDRGELVPGFDRLGAIHHDVGWDHLEGGGPGRDDWLTLQWPDTQASFVLQAVRHAAWTGDRAFLERTWPAIEGALAFTARLDRDGDEIPDLWGQGSCTYDGHRFPYFGTQSFVATLHLASLGAGAMAARALGREETAAGYERRLERGRATVLEELWRPDLGHLIAWRDDTAERWADGARAHEAESHACLVGQLAGQWAAHELDLPAVLPDDVVRSSLARIAALNDAGSAFGVADAAGPDGAEPGSWPYYADLHYTALGLLEDAGTAPLGAMRDATAAMYDVDGSPWDACLYWDERGEGGRHWGRFYMSNPSPWAVLAALHGVAPNHLTRTLGFGPSTAGGVEVRDVPVWMPGWTGRVTATAGPDVAEYRLEVEAVLGAAPRFERLVTRVPAAWDGVGEVSVDGRVLDAEPAGRARRVAVEVVVELEVGTTVLVRLRR